MEMEITQRILPDLYAYICLYFLPLSDLHSLYFFHFFLVICMYSSTSCTCSYRPRTSSHNEKRGYWTRYGRGKQEWLEKQQEQEELEEYLTALELQRRYPPSVISSLRDVDEKEIDLHLVVALLRHISRQGEGAVLVFLPGWDTISKLHDMLMADVMFHSKSQYLIIPLHSMMPTTTQRQVG